MSLNVYGFVNHLPVLKIVNHDVKDQIVEFTASLNNPPFVIWNVNLLFVELSARKMDVITNVKMNVKKKNAE
tara:strand:- start:11374 stop:11589 length:216 start_codon:yes stop_codon:yes gene_type:complete